MTDAGRAQLVHSCDSLKLADVPVAHPQLELPLVARKRNLAIDPSGLQTGDLLLFRPKRWSAVSRAIRMVQRDRLGFPDEHASWTHAGIYMGGDWVLCEAVPTRGVRIGHLYERAFDQDFRVRRDPGLAYAESWRIAERALSYLWQPYNFKQIRDLALNRLRLTTDPERKYIERALICSDLFARAYWRATKRPLTGTSQELAVTPALLSSIHSLEDQPLQWCRLR